MLQYFRPSLSYHLLLRSLFCLVLSGRLRQVLLYITLQIGKSTILLNNAGSELSICVILNLQLKNQLFSNCVSSNAQSKSLLIM